LIEQMLCEVASTRPLLRIRWAHLPEYELDPRDLSETNLVHPHEDRFVHYCDCDHAEALPGETSLSKQLVSAYNRKGRRFPVRKQHGPF
jgi:hypothetical protein